MFSTYTSLFARRRSTPPVFQVTQGRRAWRWLGFAAGCLAAIMYAVPGGNVMLQSQLALMRPSLHGDVAAELTQPNGDPQGYRALVQAQHRLAAHSDDLREQIADAVTSDKRVNPGGDPTNTANTWINDAVLQRLKSIVSSASHNLYRYPHLYRYPYLPMAQNHQVSGFTGPEEEQTRLGLPETLLNGTLNDAGWYNGSAIACAAYLRYASAWKVRIEQPVPSDGEVEFLRWRQRDWKRDGINDPHLLADYDRIAQIGERADPYNAFFPLMRAYGQWAAGREQAALRSLDQAAHQQGWNDYTNEETAGRLALAYRQFGDASVLGWSLLAAGVGIGENEAVRSLARHIVYQAQRQEFSGNTHAGLALRQRLLRVGALMREASPHLMTKWTAANVAGIAMSRAGDNLNPDILPEMKFVPSRVYPENQLLLLDRYTQFLRSNGQAREVNWTVQNMARDISVQSAGWNDVTHSLTITGLVLWCVGLTLLGLLLPLLIATGLTGTLLYRRRWERGADRPLAPAMAQGIAAGLMLCAITLGAINIVLFDLLPLEWLLPTAGLLVARSLLLGVRQGRTSLLPMLRTVLGVGLPIALTLWLCNGLLTLFLHWNALYLLNGGYDLSSSGFTLRAGFAASEALLLPVALTALATLWKARRQQTPATALLVKTLHRHGITSLAVGTLAYALCLSLTARNAAQIRYDTERILTDELTYTLDQRK